MGDVAMTVPVVESLRAADPGLRITMVTRPFFRPFFRDVPGLEFIELQPKGRHKGFMGLVRLARDIRATGADALADLHDVLRTKLVRRMLGIAGMRVVKIDKGRYERYELTRRAGKVFAQITPMIERYRKTILRFGIRFNMQEPPERSPRPMPASLVVGSKRGAVWIGVAPFAKHKGKIYPIPLADQLIGLLAEKYGKVFIFGGGDHEKSFAEAMEQRHLGVISVVGKISLSDEMDVISNLDAIVTMDSASMHIASLMGTPAISVWGATHPYAGFYGWGQDAEDAVQLDMPCRPCSIYGNKKCIFGDYRCLAEIQPEMIVAAVDRRVKEVRRKAKEAAAEKRNGRKAEAPKKEEGLSARERAAAVREAARRAEQEQQAQAAGKEAAPAKDKAAATKEKTASAPTTEKAAKALTATKEKTGKATTATKAAPAKAATSTKTAGAKAALAEATTTAKTTSVKTATSTKATVATKKAASEKRDGEAVEAKLAKAAPAPAAKSASKAKATGPAPKKAAAEGDTAKAKPTVKPAAKPTTKSAANKDKASAPDKEKASETKK